jgi:hypothetical protein
MKKHVILLLTPIFLLSACSNGGTSSSATTTSAAASLTSETSSSISSSAAKVWAEQVSDGGVSVTSSAIEVGVYSSDHPGLASYRLPVSFTWSNTTQLSTNSFEISDESILPIDAITWNVTNSSQSNLIVGGDFVIDLTKIHKTGSVYIQASFASGNVSSYKGTIVKKITFVPFGSVSYTAYHETLALDYSATTFTNPVKVIFQVEDLNYVYGLKNENRDASNYYLDFFQVDLTLETTKSKDIPFVYYVGHTYSLTFQVQMDATNYRSYHFLSTTGSGSTATGFNQYDADKNELSFIADGIKLAIKLTNQYD